MEIIRLNLAEILAVAWVWQCEIHPKYTEIWSCYGTKCGCVRKPELHVQSYRTFLDQICSETPEIDLQYTKGALSMFCANAATLFCDFAPASRRNTSHGLLNFATSKIEELVSGRIRAAEQIHNIPAVDLQAARKTIKKLLAIDNAGNLQYEPTGLAIATFKRRNLHA